MNKSFKAPNMYKWAEDLYPICRSLTGPGVRETLGYIQKLIPDIMIHSIKSGETVFDWQVPLEWTIKDAYIKNSSGEKIIDFKVNNLHVVGYSEPVDCILNLDELQQHLHSIPSQPNAIPYITSYYSSNWGFCMTEDQRRSLESGSYHVVIDSELKNGVLNYADLVIEGQSKKEVFLSTYICHPSMGNNELSGPVVATALAKWVKALNNPYYTYRFVFIPETIGSIVYLSQHIENLKKNVIAGFNITCVGDDRCYSFMPSRQGNALSDRVGKHILKAIDPKFISYSFLARGSDERQYCAPGVDLPITSLMRSKYDTYPEYHTSLDDLSLISQTGLEGGLNALIKSVEAIENNCFPKALVLGEPHLGKRGLYPETSTKASTDVVRTMLDLYAYSDGTIDLVAIAETINVPVWELYEIVQSLVKHGLLAAPKESL
jgi:aminopeptidase-like protein